MTEEQRDKEYIQYFEKISNSKEYHTIQRYFTKSNCTDIRIVGHVVYLCRSSGARAFYDWYTYYTGTDYYRNFSFAVTRLYMCLLEHNLRFSKKVIYICLKTFIIYQTWVGCQQESRAVRLLQDKDFYCIHTSPYSDMAYGVDLICFYKSHFAFGLQVKPTSYIPTETDKKRLDRFINRFHVPVYYLRCTSKTKNL